MGDSSSTSANPRRDRSAASEAEGDKMRSDLATQQAKINALQLAKKGGGFVSKTDQYSAPGLKQWDTTTDAGRKAAARYPGGPDTVKSSGGSFADAEGDYTTTQSSAPWYEQAIAGGTMPDKMSGGYSGPNWTPGAADDRSIKAGSAIAPTDAASAPSAPQAGESMWGAGNPAGRTGQQENMDAALAKKRAMGGSASTLG